MGDQPRKWVEWLPWAEYSYNTYLHSSTKVIPFEALYGIPPPSLHAYISGTSKVQAVDTYLCDKDERLRELRYQLAKAQERMQNHSNQHRRDVTFTVGDFVYLKLQPYRQTTVAF